jgi:hypothetical protein
MQLDAISEQKIPKQSPPVKKKLIAVEQGNWPVKECACTCGKDNIRSHFHSSDCECLIKGE